MKYPFELGARFVEPYPKSICFLSLDSCLNNLFFVPATSGLDPVVPSDFIPSLDFSNTRNSQYVTIVMGVP